MAQSTVRHRKSSNGTDDFSLLSTSKVTERTFKNSEKSIDFVLVYSSKLKQSKNITEETIINKRKFFENGLLNQGLELEKDVEGCLTFVKIHAPKAVLQKYCEILKMRMPMKETAEEKERIRQEFNIITEVNKACKRCVQFFITIDPGNYRNKAVLLAEYRRDKTFLFDEDSPDFYTSTVRTLVVDFILSRQNWSDDETDMDSVGIQILLDEGVYKAAYPLHDGCYYGDESVRSNLYTEWAQLNKWIRLQPIDQVKDYLGVKCGIYFAWLGFYTQLLILASILGIAVLIYGYFTSSTDFVSGAICNETLNITMCPLCDQTCDYWHLSDTCLYAQVSYLFDNSFTVFFAFLMSVWGTLFLELWKRHSAVLALRWGLSGYTVQAEHPRPQYLAQLANSKKTKINVITGHKEPVVPFWFIKLPTITLSYSIILLFIFIALGAVFSIVLCRMSMSAALSSFNRYDWLAEHSSVVISATSGFLNLISIMLLNLIYNKVAVYLTEMELHRTQTEYERSLSIKIYLFQFVNYYASIIYIAFFKGKYIGSPAKYNKILGYRQEECNPGGCFMELSIQLIIIMVGQQIFSSILEMIVPIGWSWFNQYSLKNYKIVTSEEDIAMATSKPWTEDYKLIDWGTEGLFSEYLEVAMQFGFVTLFVSAFPLAPLFALLNNIFELRLDAQKILKYYRRPVPHQVPHIGIWYRILDIIGKLAVITNATIIAFSSSFVPKLVYRFTTASTENIEAGFLNFTLAYFDTADFTDVSRPLYPSDNVTMCRYIGFREPPWSPHKYKRSVMYWKILVAKLLFILIFQVMLFQSLQNVVYAVKVAVQWLIPDTPQKVTDQIKKENYLTTHLIIQREKELAISSAAGQNSKNGKVYPEISDIAKG